jgi:hypothetical protein
MNYELIQFLLIDIDRVYQGLTFSHRWNRSGFLTTETGTGLKKSDRTGPAGLPVRPFERRPAGLPVTGRSNFYTDTNCAS